MITSRREWRGGTLGLALLMAFPWQLALSAMEGTTQSLAIGSHSSRLDETSHHLEFSGLGSARAPLDYLTFSLVMGEWEEEGDDGSTFAFNLVAFPADGYSDTIESAALPALEATERSSPLLAQRLRLRC